VPDDQDRVRASLAYKINDANALLLKPCCSRYLFSEAVETAREKESVLFRKGIGHGNQKQRDRITAGGREHSSVR
jgi:GTP cyclohydrolase III